jgi:hypothetical protein
MPTGFHASHTAIHGFGGKGWVMGWVVKVKTTGTAYPWAPTDQLSVAFRPSRGAGGARVPLLAARDDLTQKVGQQRPSWVQGTLLGCPGAHLRQSRAAPTSQAARPLCAGSCAHTHTNTYTHAHAHRTPHTAHRTPHTHTRAHMTWAHRLQLVVQQPIADLLRTAQRTQ